MLQTAASLPAAIEPPDTLEIRLSFDSSPSSFKRINAPAWKSMARKPPPDIASATPGSRLPPSQLNVAIRSAT